MAENARGVHVSPGVYSREVDMNYAVKSLGITTLGLVGETKKGPAFQSMTIKNWREFQDVFGGTSAEKFAGSQYPKYELPYIAKSYLTESNQLEVCRVLGLSGFNAGPAWLITAPLKDTGKSMVVAVLRSRGDYEKYVRYEANSANDCACPPYEYDRLSWRVGDINFTGLDGYCKYPKHCFGDAVQLKNYIPFHSQSTCENVSIAAGVTNHMNVSSSDYGHFKIVGVTGKINITDIKNDESALANAIQSGKTEFLASYGETYGDVYFEYSVSLNPNDKDYILKVLGSNPQDGDAPLYVESLYDVAYQEMVDKNKIAAIDSKLTFFDTYYMKDFSQLAPVNDFLTKKEDSLSRRDLGKRFLCYQSLIGDEPFTTCHLYNYQTKQFVIDDNTHEAKLGELKVGDICTVRQYTAADNKRYYYYAKIDLETIPKTDLTEESFIKGVDYEQAPYIAADTLRLPVVGTMNDSSGERVAVVVKNLADDFYYRIERIQDGETEEVEPTGNTPTQTVTGENIPNDPDDVPTSTATGDEENNGDEQGITTDPTDETPTQGEVTPTPKEEYQIVRVSCDLNNYKSGYRFASTPWFVSEVKGDYQNVEVNKLFRFHTISDGNSANNEIKVSIANIKPDDGTFDVIIRSIDDTDGSMKPLETYIKCDLKPGSNHYLGLLVGTYDGNYESHSKYVTVEINESLSIQNSVPAGFLGYPIPAYDGDQVYAPAAEEELTYNTQNNKNLLPPMIAYNTTYYEDIKNKRQFFGLSDLTGVDIDLFTFKGNAAYVDDDPDFLTQGFHLDSRLNKETNPDTKVYVDGIDGYQFDAVSLDSVTDAYDGIPLIGTEADMMGSIYENVNLRKFTVYFYGGFDGWDIHRDARTTSDDFKASKYRGVYSQSSGEGYAFDKILDPESLGLNQGGITSDWYAYLAGIRTFANPEEVDINVFATPGIDIINDTLLVQEAIEMIESERADSIYVPTLPDKPYGASDFNDEMYTADEIVGELDDTGIDSNYTCVYYPWVKYYDTDNNQYINLPVTKDVVRNMALTDNTTHPWFAPAGISRGDVNCVYAHAVTKLSDEDTLYEGRINPVKTFANDGVKIWGQKNLQVEESQLNRIAVRRLLLRMRKLTAIACRSLLFDPNDNNMKNSFISVISPILDNIRSNRGISDYKIEVNDSQEARDRRELPAKIYFKPYNALEYITLDFVVTPEGVDFNNI